MLKILKYTNGVTPYIKKMKNIKIWINKKHIDIQDASILARFIFINILFAPLHTYV